LLLGDLGMRETMSRNEDLRDGWAGAVMGAG
jgi:hypothetical protein